MKTERKAELYITKMHTGTVLVHQTVPQQSCHLKHKENDLSSVQKCLYSPVQTIPQFCHDLLKVNTESTLEHPFSTHWVNIINLFFKVILQCS